MVGPMNLRNEENVKNFFIPWKYHWCIKINGRKWYVAWTYQLCNRMDGRKWYVAWTCQLCTRNGRTKLVRPMDVPIMDVACPDKMGKDPCTSHVYCNMLTFCLFSLRNDKAKVSSTVCFLMHFHFKQYSITKCSW